MRLISIRPCFWLITNPARRTRRSQSICFRTVSSSTVSAVAHGRRKGPLLTLCSRARFDGSLEIGHALARAFGIVGEYSFVPGPISHPRCENANVARFTKGYQGAKEFIERGFEWRPENATVPLGAFAASPLEFENNTRIRTRQFPS